MQNSSPHRSSIGQLNANSVAALCYGTRESKVL